MSSKISVILPVRNAEGTLLTAIESCLQQRWENFELLLVLNGCEDGSLEIAEAARVRDKRVQILNSPSEQGVAGAMQLGVEFAKCEIIARMDADDIARPTRFEKQLNFLNEHPEVDVVSSQVRLLDSLGAGMSRYVDWVNGMETPESVARERFIECPVIQPSLMMRREAVIEAGGYCVRSWAEDHDLFLRMLEQGVQFGKVPEVLLEWRDSENRLTRSHPAYAEEEVWKMKAHYLARLPMVQSEGVVICGAGPIGKRLGKLLTVLGVSVHGFFEVHPRRIGTEIAGCPVVGSGELGSRWRGAVLLSAVGVEGGRERVRELVQSAEYQEGRDFFATC